MIGAFITDDFYFCFAKEDIEKLRQGDEVSGHFTFLRSDKHEPKTIKLIVKIVSVNKEHISYSFDFFAKKNPRVVTLFLADVHGEIDWLFDENENYPGWRFASCNVYCKIEGKDSDYESMLNSIFNFANINL